MDLHEALLVLIELREDLDSIYQEEPTAGDKERIKALDTIIKLFTK